MVRKRHTGLTDSELAAACAAGEEGAFDQLMTAHRDMIYTLCLRMTGTPDEADDCAQETFVKAFRMIASFKGSSALSTWLYRIAYNTCIDHSRAAARRKIFRLFSNDRHELLDLPDRREDPQAALNKKERAAAVAAAIAKLDPVYRAAVVMYDMEGHSYEEIAEVTGVPVGTVKSRLSRGRHQLRGLFRGEL